MLFVVINLIIAVDVYNDRHGETLVLTGIDHGIDLSWKSMNNMSWHFWINSYH